MKKSSRGIETIGALRATSKCQRRTAQQLARAIVNCRQLNEAVPPTPPLHLVSMKRVFQMLSRLSRPSGLTGDFRHGFVQIPLPMMAKKHFTVCCGERAFQWRTLPMGFSFAPLIAQATSMAIWEQAIQSVGFVAEPSLVGDDAPPEYWRIKTKTLAFASRVL